MHFHNYQKSGIATALVAVIIIVIVVIAGVGAYLALTSGSSSTSTPTTSTVVTTSSSSPLVTTTTTSSSSSPSSSSSSQVTTTSSSSSTPPSTTSTSPTSTSTITSSIFSCTTTYGSGTYTYSTATSTGLGAIYAPLIDLFGNFSQMTMVFNTTETASYQVVGKPTVGGIATYQVNYNTTYQGQPLIGTAYFAMNGTIIQVVTNGQTLSGYMAFTALAAFIPFFIEATFAGYQTLYTGSSFVSVQNHTTVQLGPSSVSVTNYKANNLPFTISNCGYTSTVTKFSLQIGQVSGVNYALLTFADFEGTSQGTSYAFTLQITSVSK